MTIRFARRTLLQTGIITAGVAVSAKSVIADRPPAKLSSTRIKASRPQAYASTFPARGAWKLLKTFRVEENGRVGEQGPLMNADTMAIGPYELLRGGVIPRFSIRCRCALQSTMPSNLSSPARRSFLLQRI